MRANAMLRHRSLWAALAAAGALCFSGAALAQYSHEPSKSPATPPSAASKAGEAKGNDMMAAKPIIPSKSEMPDAAFKKLDAGGKGYVSKEDTKGLSGFDKPFQTADANHDGKLDPSEFKKAWAAYTGRSG